MAGLADLGRHDVDVDRKQTSFLDGVSDRADHRGAVAIGAVIMASFTMSVRFLYACLNLNAFSVVL